MLLLLKFFCQVQDQELFDLELLFGFPGLRRRLRGSSCHFFSNCGQEPDFFNTRGNCLLETCYLLLAGLDVFFQGCNLGFCAFVLYAFFH